MSAAGCRACNRPTTSPNEHRGAPPNAVATDRTAPNHQHDAGDGTESVVLFWDAGGQESRSLFPIACFNGALKQAQGGQTCLDLVPERTIVGKAGGETLEVVGRVPVPCAGEDEAAADKALTATPVSRGFQPSPTSAWAVWPVSKATSVLTIPTPGSPPAIDATDLEALTRAARASGGSLTASLQIAQVMSADLDGDGRNEMFFVGSFRAQDEEPSNEAWSGLLSKSGVEPPQIAVLQQDMLDTYEVLAILDIEGDGRMEMLVRSSYYEGMAVSLFRLAGGRLEPVGYYECGV